VLARLGIWGAHSTPYSECPYAENSSERKKFSGQLYIAIYPGSVFNWLG